MRRTALVLAGCLAATTAAAHDGALHGSDAGAALAAAPAPLPLEIVARFSLTDQDGRRLTERDFAGRPLLLFFGYAACEGICPAALPAMADLLDRLGPQGEGLAAAMITVDPVRDTPGAMRRALGRIHPRLVGLTGTEAELAAARRAFQVEVSEVTRTADGPVYAHGSFIYLVGPDGRVAALLPPILSAERMAEIVARHTPPSPNGLRPGE